MTAPTNTDRAQWAADAVEPFARAVNGWTDHATGCRDDIIDAVGDLMCDLGHYMRLTLMMDDDEIARAYSVALQNFAYEEANPEG